MRAGASHRIHWGAAWFKPAAYRSGGLGGPVCFPITVRVVESSRCERRAVREEAVPFA
jgi:hypothetical protein